jgi:hypothetical protein
MKNILPALVISAAITLITAHGEILIQDDFGTSGSLVGSVPQVGGVWQSLSGTADSLLASSGGLQIQDDNTEDAESDFVSLQAGTLYAGFTLTMSASDLPSTGGDYFASFREGAGNDGRIFALRPAGTAAGKYRLGISNAEAGAVVYWVNDFVTLWVGPSVEASLSISTPAAAFSASLSAFAFRQTSVTGDMNIDDLVVSTSFAEAIPEPLTGILTGLGCLVVMVWRRCGVRG